MKIAFLNLCHTDPPLVARVAAKLTENPNFDMYVHVDAKQDIAEFESALSLIDRVFFTPKRYKVYWGGFNAINATCELLRIALASSRQYDYFCLLQNLDYPIKSNAYIEEFFEQRSGTEFIRGCNIANTRDRHFAKKYRLYYRRDSDFYLQRHPKLIKLLRTAGLAFRSLSTLGFNGIIREHGQSYPIYYGAAQWAITRECAEYILDFSEKHPKFNQVMRRIQFPDEEYFHTIVHNSRFRERCIRHGEPVQRWLVNWRNLHYFEYPREITVFEEKDYEHLMQQDALFIRKVRTEQSEALLDRIDASNM